MHNLESIIVPRLVYQRIPPTKEVAKLIKTNNCFKIKCKFDWHPSTSKSLVQLTCFGLLTIVLMHTILVKIKTSMWYKMFYWNHSLQKIYQDSKKEYLKLKGCLYEENQFFSRQHRKSNRSFTLLGKIVNSSVN